MLLTVMSPFECVNECSQNAISKLEISERNYMDKTTVYLTMVIPHNGEWKLIHLGDMLCSGNACVQIHLPMM